MAPFRRKLSSFRVHKLDFGKREVEGGRERGGSRGKKKKVVKE